MSLRGWSSDVCSSDLVSVGARGIHQRTGGDDLGPLNVAGEFGDIGGGGVDHQFLGRADLDDGPILHDGDAVGEPDRDRKSTRLNSSHVEISYAVFCLK